MSAMLEQAIIDAKALREAAKRTAQSSILEKYTDEVKGAVNRLLEQEDEDFGLDMGMDVGPDTGEAEFGMEEVPLAATDGENLCPCPEEEEEIEIDFAELEKQMGAPEETHEELGDDLGLDMGNDMDIGDDEEFDLNEDIVAELLNLTENDDEEEEIEEACEEEDDFLQAAGEEVPDNRPEYKGDSADLKLSEGEIKKAITEAVKLSNGNKEKVLTENKQLKNKLSHVIEENKKMQNKNKEYEDTIQEISSKLEEVSLMNGRLFYTNRVLKSDSLNERQKNTIVEAISEAGSVDEAKVICETLENTVRSLGNNTKKGPKSLREVVSQKSTMIQQTRRKPKQDDLLADRMKRLAGLK